MEEERKRVRVRCGTTERSEALQTQRKRKAKRDENICVSRKETEQHTGWGMEGKKKNAADLMS